MKRSKEASKGKAGMSIKILIADDHSIVRQGLRDLLDKKTDMEVIAESGSGLETIRLASDLKPDVILMDVTMPDMNGIEATRQIISRLPYVKIVALSMHGDKLFVERMFRAGAKGYLTKDCNIEELTEAIHKVIDNKTYISSGIAGAVLEGYLFGKASEDSSVFSILTNREREVLQLLTEGKTARDVADSFCVSVKTIETHRRKIMRKLGIKSIAELTKYAIREGVTAL